jgi:hypothetical protein
MGEEVMDANGVVTGYLLTPDEYKRLMYDHFKVAPLNFNPEEARPQPCRGMGKTTEEVLDMLRHWKDNPPERRA